LPVTRIAEQQRNNGKETRMIKVNVMYPYSEGARFDHAYYRDRHMPMVQMLLGKSIDYFTIDKGLGGAEPGTPAPFVAMVHMHFQSVELFEAAFAPVAAQIIDDVKNYTDIEPVLQVSEVVVG
jgi:uncharacterized protein (TIGR02118 family)